MGMFDEVLDCLGCDLSDMVACSGPPSCQDHAARIEEYRKAMRVLRDAPKIAYGLVEAERFGAEKDEPEGSRWIQISDTLAKQLAEKLLGIEPGTPR